jgi:ADP-ribose pyrophosphatase
MTEPDTRETAFSGTQFEVVVEQWGDDRREIVEHAGSVAIVAIDREGRVLLVRQFREPARRTLLELPAGAIDEGEEPLESAKRELEEETGYRGGRWRELGELWTSPGFLRELMHLFLAEDVEPGEPSPDEDEEVELVHVPFDEAVATAADTRDAKTVAGLLLAAAARR